MLGEGFSEGPEACDERAASSVPTHLSGAREHLTLWLSALRPPPTRPLAPAKPGIALRAPSHSAVSRRADSPRSEAETPDQKKRGRGKKRGRRQGGKN